MQTSMDVDANFGQRPGGLPPTSSRRPSMLPSTWYPRLFWPKANLASISMDICVVSASTIWTPTLSPASSDVDANFSDLHALQSRIFGSKLAHPLGSCPQRRGGSPAREDEPRREERAEQQAPAPQGPVLPPPPPVDYGERADVWWASLLRTRFEDGAIDVAWDEFMRLFRAKFVPEHIQDRMEQEFLSLAQGSMTMLEYEARFSELSKYAPHIVTDERRKTKKFVMGLKPSLRTRLMAFDHRTLDEALSAACRQEGDMEQYLEEKKASQKRPAAMFQRQDKKKAVYPTQQRSVAVGSTQVTSVRSPSVKKECPHCGRTHGGSECWLITGKCLKCGSSDHKIKDCPRLQQRVQRGAPTPAVAAAAPATGRPGRPRAPARVLVLKRYSARLFVTTFT
ncbi:hypothetical protein Taro_015549, partial [Colocasia esculenta]|nr:hypothetical protein [Colocasia esculenta]